MVYSFRRTGFLDGFSSGKEKHEGAESQCEQQGKAEASSDYVTVRDC